MFWVRLFLNCWQIIAVCFHVDFNAGSPELDEQGREIEDEFSKLPFVQQRIKRFYNKVLYYTKVSELLQRAFRYLRVY